jgi:FkbH-like protein
VVFQSSHKLLAAYNLLLPEERHTLADKRAAFVQGIADTYPGRLIYGNYPELDDGVFGSFANKQEGSFIYQVRKLNYTLMQIALQKSNLFIWDLAALEHTLGRSVCFDTTLYVSGDMVLSLDVLPAAASRIMDVIGAAEGQIKKCLILDLDNTLWGGVIGDDGLENIQLGHGLGIGKVFTELQHWIKKLKDRGIILAVCSKNDEAVAKEPFEQHPDMVLTLEDIAVFMANWDNKADNIRRIQSILNIGFDSMVFLDDNPAERALVRTQIPGIRVPELPEDPALYVEYLGSLNLFETASYAAADAARTQQYHAEARRAALQQTFTGEADFLKSLAMVSQVKGFDGFTLPRVAQLSQRSNQFNLRTVRYTEEDVRRLAADPGYEIFSFTLSDTFGDHGLIAVLILKKQDRETLFIDTWLMSCRVLQRGMEHFTLNTIVAYAQEKGFKRIIGEYIPTAKNQMVAAHYPHLGFVPLSGEKRFLYELTVEGYEPKPCFIKTSNT